MAATTVVPLVGPQGCFLHVAPGNRGFSSSPCTHQGAERLHGPALRELACRVCSQHPTHSPRGLFSRLNMHCFYDQEKKECYLKKKTKVIQEWRTEVLVDSPGTAGAQALCQGPALASSALKSHISPHHTLSFLGAHRVPVTLPAPQVPTQEGKDNPPRKDEVVTFHFIQKMRKYDRY